MKRAVILAALALGACSQPGEFRGSALKTEHPLPTYVASHPGAAITIDSGGGSTNAWRGLGVASVKSRVSVTLRGECVSACLLYALAVASKGVPVHVEQGTVLMFHGIGSQHTAGQPSNQAAPGTIDLDVALWQFMGLPKWAAEIERGLTVHDYRPLTNAEFVRAKFQR